MDDVEESILAAWLSLLPRLETDSPELARRLRRGRAATLSRPPRAWCIALRASDTRLTNQEEGARQKDEPTRVPAGPFHPSSFIPHPSPITLTRDDIARLAAPVCLDDAAPGLTLAETARRLGVSTCGLLHGRVRGTFRQRYVEGLEGRWGHPRPILYTGDDRRAGDTAARTQRHGTWLIDYAADGRTIGIEFTSVGTVDLAELNRLLAAARQPALSVLDVHPLEAA